MPEGETLSLSFWKASPRRGAFSDPGLGCWWATFRIPKGHLRKFAKDCGQWYLCACPRRSHVRPPRLCGPQCRWQTFTHAPPGSASRLVELVSHMMALPLLPQRRHRHLGPFRIHAIQIQSQAQGVVLKALPPQRRRRLPRPVRTHMSQNQTQTVGWTEIASLDASELGLEFFDLDAVEPAAAVVPPSGPSLV